ncbi:MAG: uracil-DNA glycosylase [Clostridiales bacterium]|nr:uracil-DNA glycosylase [Clostridiales bacterium]
MGLADNTWDKFLAEEQKKIYFLKLKDFIIREYQNKNIYPPLDKIFTAFSLTPPEKIKAVIVGQDPYHQPNQAHGLAFSVGKDVKIPPSLRNIFKELNSDLGTPMPKNGNLSLWAEQGVFLINSVLTVEEGKPESHCRKGWETFTDAAISYINNLPQPVVYILWGKNAQAKERLINNKNHLVLKAPHPSPLSATRGFFGSNPFSTANNFLINNGAVPIDWDLNKE